MATHLPDDLTARYEVREWRNGLAILEAARPQEWAEILTVLAGFTLLKSDILKPGGSKSLIANRIDGHFTRLGWREKKFDTKIVVDGQEYQAPTHRRGPSYGNSTTHMAKLIPRLNGGGGGGCPVVAIGIRKEAYIDDGPAA
ncbi:MAG: hypothetical protein JNM20_15995 [Rhizobiales bacterium]|nr:hypothetical protein [Hyphomicrobiales bacterium]